MPDYRFTEQNHNILFRMIDDVEKALEAEAYLAALSLVLTIPDVCGKAAFPNRGSKYRYIKWFDDEIGYTEKKDYSHLTEEKSEIYRRLPFLNGEAVYQLRCAVLHQGNPGVDDNEIQNSDNKIGRFIIEYEKPKALDFYSDTAKYNHISGEKSYTVNLNNLCLKICSVAKEYYLQNKDKFDFFQFELIDKDERLSQLFNR